jgi:hypothetical protein
LIDLFQLVDPFNCVELNSIKNGQPGPLVKAGIRLVMAGFAGRVAVKAATGPATIACSGSIATTL